MWHSLWQGEFTPNRIQAQTPRVSPHYCFVGGVKFPQGEGSAVIHSKKNDLFHKDTTYRCEQVLFVYVSTLIPPCLTDQRNFIYCTISNPGTGADDAFCFEARRVA